MNKLDPIFSRAKACLDGKVPYSSLGPAERHLCALPIHRAAQYVLKGKDRGERNWRLMKAPASIRPAVKAEAERLYAQK